MKAEFIGEDGSMGFLKGGVYEIETYVKSQLLRKDGWIWVKVKGSPLKCPYTSVETFLTNWRIVEHEHK